MDYVVDSNVHMDYVVDSNAHMDYVVDSNAHATHIVSNTHTACIVSNIHVACVVDSNAHTACIIPHGMMQKACLHNDRIVISNQCDKTHVHLLFDIVYSNMTRHKWQEDSF